MEFVDGPDLMEFYKHAPKPFDVPLALTLIRGIAEGLGAAHAAGVVHRDIKAENILIAHERDELVPKIADFGIVATKDETRLTLSGVAMLTPQFAAPEQWLGKPTAELDGRTDFYALGGLLFELLTGQSAIDKADGQDWAFQHLNAFPRLPSSLRPELAKWRSLDEFVLRLLAKDPNDRPQDVRELLRLLKRISYAPPESAHSPAAGALPEAPMAAAVAPAEAAAPLATALAKPSAVAVDNRSIEAPGAGRTDPRGADFNTSGAGATSLDTPAPDTSGLETSAARKRTKLAPMPIWEPFQPRSAIKPRAAVDETEQTSRNPVITGCNRAGGGRSGAGRSAGDRDHGQPVAIAGTGRTARRDCGLGLQP